VKAAEAAAQDLLVEAFLINRTAAAHVPGQSPTYTETRTSIKICLYSYRDHEIDGDRIRQSDMRAVGFPSSTLQALKPNDLILVGPTYYRVYANLPVMVGSSVAVHQLQLRVA
jgi:hypothetical protein